MELTERQQRILKSVVEDYVLSAIPVPSEKIAGRPQLKVSSATVRNEMVELEELGLLTHPHTSAGRIPTDQGYRYYIEHLMAETAVTPVEQQMVWHQFHQVEAEVDEWGPLAAAVMAQMARSAAVVTKLRAREHRFKRLELVSVQDDLVLVVLIMRSGALQQRMLHLDRPIGRDELIRVANKLSSLMENKTATQLLQQSHKLEGLEQELVLLSARMMEQVERSWGDALYYEGIGFVSGEPEFGRSDQILDLMEMLHRGSVLVPLLSDVLESNSLRVVIGSENVAQQMRGYSVVLKRYGMSGEAAGVLGLVGPTRMRYWRAVALVRFMADLLDHLVEQSLR